MELSREIAAKVLATVDAGLVAGMGEPIPGHMCVEAAVCYALGLPHGDNPICVGSAVRVFKIVLNDSGWGSEEARAKGMRKLAIAQLGSDQIDQLAFSRYVVLETVKRVLPIALRREGMEEEASACEKVTDLSQARAAAAYAARVAAFAAKAVEAVANAAINAAELCSHNATHAAAFAAAYAADTADAAAKDYAAEFAARAAADSLNALQVSAQIGLEALQAQNSPGCQWLDLCEVA